MDQSKNKISLIEKYNCINFYLELVDCLDKNKEGKYRMCNENIKNIGQCVFKGMKQEEKVNKNQN